MAARFPDDTLSVCSGVTGISGLSEDFLNCLICTDPFHNPKVLPCHHTFCGPCLEKYFSSLQQDLGSERLATFPCPVCRQAVPVPDQGLQGLLMRDVKTEQIEGLVAKIQTHKKLRCDVCKYKQREISARDHCTSCSINYCEHCSHEHHQHTLFQNHSVIPVTQVDSSSMRCEVHTAEMVKYFCATCVAPLCTVCAVTDHVNHQTMELQSALGNKKDMVESKIASMSEKVMTQEEFLSHLEDIQSIKEAAYKKTRLEVERHVNSLIGHLHQRKQALLNELDKSHQVAVKQLALEKENCQFQLANMKSLWKFAAKLTEPSQSIQLLAMHGDLTAMVDGVVTAPPPRLAKECASMTMFMPKEHMSVGDLQKCDLSMDLVRRVSGAGGHMTNGTAAGRTPSPTGLGVSPPHHPAAAFQSSFFHEPLTLKWQSPRVCWKVDKIGAKTGEINEAYDVTITPNGTAIVAEWLNQRLQVFDATGFSRDMVGQGLVQPWGVCLTREGHLAVTDEKDRTVKVLTTGGALVRAWKKLSFGWPRGLAINQAGQFIVTDTQHGKHTVSIHLPDGQCVRQFGSQGSGNEQFHWPRYVTVDHQDRIVVSDSSNHCIKVFDPTGQFLFKFGSIGTADGQLKHPRGVCIDPNNNIVVADQDNDRVSLYTPEGKLTRHILTIKRPWGVALSEGGLLAVTQKSALSLYKVFDPMP